jgi:Protein of unknown function (DUF1064)
MPRIDSTSKQIDGYIFDSQPEARRYLYLKSRLQTGEISTLEIHPQFVLIPGAVSHIQGKTKQLPAITFTPDFAYMEDGAQVIEDVKPHKTDKKTGKWEPYLTKDFRLRWQILQRLHPEYIFRIADA